jgi:capsule polysaccharide export protein KpsE/RkpR
LNSYLKVVRFLMKYRGFIFWSVLLATVGVAVFSLVTPPAFRSTAQILPPTDEQDLLSTTSLLQTPTLSKMLRLGGSVRGGTSSDLLAAIFRSRAVQERVLELCNFKAEYKIRAKGVEEALKQLNKFTSVNASDEGIVRVSVDARSPVLAAKMANTYVAEVDRVLRESNMSRSRSVRIFLEQRLVQSDSELGAAAESLIEFQHEHKLVALDDETKAAVESYAKLKAQELNYDFESAVADKVMQPDHPYSQQLRRQSTGLRQQLSAFEGGAGVPGFGIGSSVPLHELPEVSARYIQLLADYKLKQELKGLLEEQYEQARIKEVRDTPAISVLDEGKVPERRSYPRRIKMTLTALFASLVIAVSLAAAFEGIQAGTRSGLDNQESARFLSRLHQESKLAARVLGFFTRGSSASAPGDPQSGESRRQ